MEQKVQYRDKYLSNDIPRPNLHALQDLHQRLSNPRPDGQRRQLIITRDQRAARHNERVFSGFQVLLCLLHDTGDHVRRTIRRRDEVFNAYFNHR